METKWTLLALNSFLSCDISILTHWLLFREVGPVLCVLHLQESLALTELTLSRQEFYTSDTLVLTKEVVNCCQQDGRISDGCKLLEYLFFELFKNKTKKNPQNYLSWLTAEVRNGIPEMLGFFWSKVHFVYCYLQLELQWHVLPASKKLHFLRGLNPLLTSLE